MTKRIAIINDLEEDFFDYEQGYRTIYSEFQTQFPMR